MLLSTATCFAVILSPNAFKTETLGPIKIIPLSSQAWAKSAFSDKKPYPGCMASAPLSNAIFIIALIFK